MKKQSVFLVLYILMLHTSFGQQAPTDQKMLPSVSGGLNKSMGNLASPNLFDGSANVNIPIHQYGDFGISVSYNTKGVTVEELSTQIGTHWNLDAGGSITRNVKDIPDETKMEFDDPASSNVYDHYTMLGRAHQYTTTSPQPSREYWDGENDEFIVSAGPLQFSFKLGKEGYVFTYPQNRCKIKPIGVYPIAPNNYTSIFNAFEITDENGVKYIFRTRDGISQSNMSFGNSGNQNAVGISVPVYYTSKWYLDVVLLSNGEEITYDYAAVEYPVEQGAPGLEGLSLYRTCTRTYYNNGSQWQDGGPVMMADFSNSTNVLRSIHYPDNTTARFVFDQEPWSDPEHPDGMCLQSVKQIEISQGSNCVKYRFNKAYLERDPVNNQLAKEVPFDNACNYNPLGRRMILKSIDILSCDESEAQPYYSFEYSNVAPPYRWGNNRDFFGYCNYIVPYSSDPYGSPNVDANNYYAQPTSCLSPFVSPGTLSGSNRAVTTNVAPMTALCLTKVKNAYGGSLSFQYELHNNLVSVTDGLPNMPNIPNVNDNLFVGKNANDGLRLYSTTAEDKYHPGNQLITRYTYSGGQYFLNGGYYAFPTKKNENNVITEYLQTANWVSPHQLINGSNHGYSKVTVTTYTDGGAMLSTTINYFSNFKENGVLNYKTINSGSNEKHYYQMPYTDKQYIADWKVGLPLKTETFDRNGNLTSRTTNVYDTEIADDYTSALDSLGVNIRRMRVGKMHSSGYPINAYNLLDPSYNIATDNYVPFRGKALLMSATTEKFVTNSLAVTDAVEYEYDERFNLQSVITHNSKGEDYMTRNIYNYDVSGPYVTAGAQTGTDLYNMTLDGIEKLVATERWKLEAPGPGPYYYNNRNQLMDASITKYTYSDKKFRTQKLFVLESLAPISHNSYIGIVSGGPYVHPYNKVLTAYNTTLCPSGFKEVSEVLQYDIKGNPVETKLGGQNTYQSMIWDLPTGNKLAVANCRLNEMAFTGFESDSKGNWNYNQANVVVPPANPGIIDGKKALRSYSYETAPFLSVSGLTPNKEYTLTFWSKGGYNHITGGGLTGEIPYTPVYGANLPNDNGWRFCVATFTPLNSSPVEFRLVTSGSPFTNYTDDVRLFPTGATLQCWNYESLWGASSSVDPTGRITYYEYDPFGRLHITRDQERNIIAKKDYHIGQ